MSNQVSNALADITQQHGSDLGLKLVGIDFKMAQTAGDHYPLRTPSQSMLRAEHG